MPNLKSENTRRITDAAIAAGTNPYVRRIIEDEELRSNMYNAFHAVRDAYGRVSTGKKSAKALAQDRKLQKDMKFAARSLREAADQLRGKPARRGGFGLGKALVVAVVGAGLVLVLSEDARKAVLDKLFGSEEEFEYSSTTNGSA